ncbi:MAG: hypothetical protein GKR87_09680 [Kiritimatiellae bacterium]|nr:hypothetical protein [Kiritimatiellia bacterium]
MDGVYELTAFILLKSYFPNRELGICLYQLGELDPAIDFLEQSLDQEPTGRTKLYLNRVRKEKFADMRVAPPRIDLSVTENTVWTRKRKQRVAGTAYGTGYIEKNYHSG